MVARLCCCSWPQNNQSLISENNSKNQLRCTLVANKKPTFSFHKKNLTHTLLESKKKCIVLLPKLQ